MKHVLKYFKKLLLEKSFCEGNIFIIVSLNLHTFSTLPNSMRIVEKNVYQKNLKKTHTQENGSKKP